MRRAGFVSAFMVAVSFALPLGGRADGASPIQGFGPTWCGYKGAGLIALSTATDCSCAFSIGGAVTLSITPSNPQVCELGTGIQVNCANPLSAMCAIGNCAIQTTSIDINGGLNGLINFVKPCGKGKPELNLET